MIEPSNAIAKTYDLLKWLMPIISKYPKDKKYTLGEKAEMEKLLFSLQRALLGQTYRADGYRQFFVYDPKKRLISAAPYPDRVVQHALCNIIEPIFDRTFIHDNYACRKDKGSLKAVDQFTAFSRKNAYVLKCDIRRYFASIDHETLYEMIKKRIKDPSTLLLIKQIIDSAADPGIPIGNLTSQIFANLYLNELDHFVKEEIKCRYYIRYMDDLVVFDNNKNKLNNIKGAIEGRLKRLKLELHPKKCQIYPVKSGVPFLGYKVQPTYRLVVRQNIIRLRRRVRKYLKLWRQGLIAKEKIACSMRSWLGYAIHANSFHLRRRLLSDCNLLGISL